MGKRFLIDSCVIVKYLDETLPPESLTFLDELFDRESNISFITKIELLAWNPSVPEEMRVRKEFLDGSFIHYIDDTIIDKTIQIRKETRIKLPDALIAATAMQYKYVLLSTNDNDFLKVIPLGLQYINPLTKHSSL